MEVDKFEKHIKRHLKEREITPSESAWNTLSEQLPVVAPKKKNTFIWYSVAAVFIGVLIMSTLYFKRSQTPSETQIQVVETPQEINVPKKEENLMVPIKEDDKLVGVKKEVIQKEKTLVAIPPKTRINDETQFALVEKEEVVGEDSNVLKTKTEELIDAKIAELATQVGLLEGSDLQVTDAEVDSLLRMAQREILADKIFQKGGKVDAMALLDEVENELDQTFREQIFESLKTGFLKVRTAVADRNN
ncbi:hypothetical protein HZY62_14765 [Maribacter polysiphoniae]|uniref:Uncharacterized protein n=1 Tax=Maribacter polysiphoniae TaxID=429344 RepID=A0A316DYB9_9FLAO|nr:hypothetical protein [Maribacter polysiphoniae]MBD1261865.1 hypothetical protein [Maribacter polysiphoniae]PWK22229.1 hypothetical protein LX92_03147 [Maribacter polysiphoniae]